MEHMFFHTTENASILKRCGVMLLALLFCVSLLLSASAENREISIPVSGIDLQHMGSVRVLVKDAEGNPVPGGTLQLFLVARIAEGEEGRQFHALTEAFSGWDGTADDLISDQSCAESLAAYVEPTPFVRPDGEVVPEMPVREQDGLRYIGIIEIPALSLSLPVLENWSYDLLKISPCRYAGSYFTNDLVICAHNYAAHFNSLRYVDIGSDVYFTTVNGESFHYVINNRETLTPEENDRMITTNGEWDLTLFTCYIGGATRCTLRCSLSDE